ncbi:hypothetical protein ACF1BN_03570 [Streptomyces sp. NPDC014861]|uniref:hypothetical protein n=1 Tax=Streptomyces sp. NPDC014861 TaxID=3364923 RepID=UPI0036FD937F
MDAFVRQTYEPGAEAEVDFGKVTVKLVGELVTCNLFTFQPSYWATPPFRSSAC